MEAVKYKNITFQVFDCAGQAMLRNLWRHYLTGAQALVFVVDSSEERRIKEAKEELVKILEHPDMEGVPLLVLANKQDLEEGEFQNDGCLLLDSAITVPRFHSWLVTNILPPSLTLLSHVGGRNPRLSRSANHSRGSALVYRSCLWYNRTGKGRRFGFFLGNSCLTLFFP
jgi:hypothetical protein